MSRAIPRRSVLAGAIVLPIVLPWLAACSQPSGAPSIGTPAALELDRGTFSSRFWPGQKVRWRLARPARPAANTAPQPLVVALHGHGGDADWPFDGLHIDSYAVPAGLAVATVDGGDFYWHARRSGVDTSSMVIEELLPLLGRKGMATDRIGLLGWSMGGYGALLMATRLGPTRVAGVVAASAALWQSPGDSAPGAFDDREDFVRHDVFAARGKLRGIPLRLDCGRDDPFIAANRAFARELPDATVTFDDGGHSEDYWTTHAGPQMLWLRERFSRR